MSAEPVTDLTDYRRDKFGEAREHERNYLPPPPPDGSRSTFDPTTVIAEIRANLRSIPPQAKRDAPAIPAPRGTRRRGQGRAS